MYNKILIFISSILLVSCASMKSSSKVECPETVTDYDGNTYKVTKIAHQCWMAADLKSTHYADGTEISESYAYNADDANAAVYGRLYTWDAAMKGAGESEAVPSGVQGACPDGWHIPSDGEWMILEKKLGVPGPHLKRQGWDLSKVGGRLKNSSDKYWNSPNKGARDDKGFNGMPSGSRLVSGVFSGQKSNSFYWSSTMLFGLTAWGRGLSASHEGIYRFNDDPGSAFSIRCVKD